MSCNQNRVDAGLKSKEDGHKFEKKVAEYTGGYLFSGSKKDKTKVDVYINKNLCLSIKNTKARSSSTQLHIGPQDNIISFLKLSSKSIDALKLFLGHTDPIVFFNFFKSLGGDIKSLSNKDEIVRHRCKCSNIPKDLMDSLIDELNKKNSEIFDMAFSHGYNDFKHVATHMVSTVIKNDLESSLVYTMEDLKELFMQGTWVISKTNSTLHLKHGDTTLCRLQVKGSTENNNGRAEKGLPLFSKTQLKAYRTSYHYAQFQVHTAIFKMCKSQPIQTIAKKLTNNG